MRGFWSQRTERKVNGYSNTPQAQTLVKTVLVPRIIGTAIFIALSKILDRFLHS